MSQVMSPTAWGRPAALRTKRPSERRSASRSATRALDVLELFGHARRPLRAVEIGAALSLHPSTVSQLLKTMVDSAHLVFDARAKRYFPSLRLAGFGGWIADVYGAGEAVRGLIIDVQSRVGNIVTLATPNDLFMQLLDLEGRARDGQIPERGLSVALFGSALGGAYLSTLDDEEAIRLAARALIPPAQRATVLRTLAEIRRTGFADGPSHDGTTWSIAIPLPDHFGPVPLVLGFAGPADEVAERREAIYCAMSSAVECRRLSDPAGDR